MLLRLLQLRQFVYLQSIVDPIANRSLGIQILKYKNNIIKICISFHNLYIRLIVIQSVTKNLTVKPFLTKTLQKLIFYILLRNTCPGKGFFSLKNIFFSFNLVNVAVKLFTL